MGTSGTGVFFPRSFRQDGKALPHALGGAAAPGACAAGEQPCLPEHVSPPPSAASGRAQPPSGVRDAQGGSAWSSSAREEERGGARAQAGGGPGPTVRRLPAAAFARSGGGSPPGGQGWPGQAPPPPPPARGPALPGVGVNSLQRRSLGSVGSVGSMGNLQHATCGGSGAVHALAVAPGAPSGSVVVVDEACERRLVRGASWSGGLDAGNRRGSPVALGAGAAGAAGAAAAVYNSNQVQLGDGGLVSASGGSFTYGRGPYHSLSEPPQCLLEATTLCMAPSGGSRSATLPIPISSANAYQEQALLHHQGSLQHQLGSSLDCGPVGVGAGCLGHSLASADLAAGSYQQLTFPCSYASLDGAVLAAASPPAGLASLAGAAMHPAVAATVAAEAAAASQLLGAPSPRCDALLPQPSLPQLEANDGALALQHIDEEFGRLLQLRSQLVGSAAAPALPATSPGLGTSSVVGSLGAANSCAAPTWLPSVLMPAQSQPPQLQQQQQQLQPSQLQQQQQQLQPPQQPQQQLQPPQQPQQPQQALHNSLDGFELSAAHSAPQQLLQQHEVLAAPTSAQGPDSVLPPRAQMKLQQLLAVKQMHHELEQELLQLLPLM